MYRVCDAHSTAVCTHVWQRWFSEYGLCAPCTWMCAWRVCSAVHSPSKAIWAYSKFSTPRSTKLHSTRNETGSLAHTVLGSDKLGLDPSPAQLRSAQLSTTACKKYISGGRGTADYTLSEQIRSCLTLCRLISSHNSRPQIGCEPVAPCQRCPDGCSSEPPTTQPLSTAACHIPDS